MSSGGTGPIPFRISDFLQGSYYVLTIVVVLLGLASFIWALKWRVEDLETHDREHPTKQELAIVAAKVDDRLRIIEGRVENLDIHGTRALADRTTLIEQGQKQQDERIQELVHRMNELQSSLNKFSSEIPVIVDRQNSNTAAIRELQQRIWGGDRDRDRSPDRAPIGPIGPGYNAPPSYGGDQRGPTAPKYPH